MRNPKLLALVMLVGGCRAEGTPAKPETAGSPSSVKAVERKARTMMEEKAIAIAKKEAEIRGHGTSDLDASARFVDGTWEVGFYRITPGAVGGGEGFMVRLKDPGGDFIDLRRFQ